MIKCNSKNTDKLRFMAAKNRNLLSPQAIEDRDNKLALTAELDQGFKAKYPIASFVLYTTDDKVIEAHDRMLNNHGSDYKTEK